MADPPSGVLPHRDAFYGASSVEWARISYAERVIGSIRRECLDFVIPMGERHLLRVLGEYARFYNTVRPHQSLGGNAPVPASVRSSRPSTSSVSPCAAACITVTNAPPESVRRRSKPRHLLVLSASLAGVLANSLGSNPATSADASLKAQMMILRQTIELYQIQHGGNFPGQVGDGDLETQLCGQSDRQGMVGAGHRYPLGPYIRNGALPNNPFVASNSLAVVARMPIRATGRTAWIYCPKTGDFRANTDRDVNGVSHFTL